MTFCRVDSFDGLLDRADSPVVERATGKSFVFHLVMEVGD
jgi:hypothetical protein